MCSSPRQKTFLHRRCRLPTRSPSPGSALRSRSPRFVCSFDCCCKAPLPLAVAVGNSLMSGATVTQTRWTAWMFVARGSSTLKKRGLGLPGTRDSAAGLVAPENLLPCHCHLYLYLHLDFCCPRLLSLHLWLWDPIDIDRLHYIKFVCVSMCRHVYVCLRMSMYVHVCIRMNLYACACMSMFVLVCACRCMCVYVCACIHVDAYGCMNV